MENTELNRTEELRQEIIRRFTSQDFLKSAMGKAVREAVRKHKIAGNAIASWEDGKVVIVQPEDIDVTEAFE